MENLKTSYKNHPELRNKPFKEFFVKLFGADLYKNFIVSTGYTDYENADVYETIYNYGMDDTYGGWTGLHIPWKHLVDKLYHKIGSQHFRFSNDVISVKKLQNEPCLFETKTVNGNVYYSNKVIVATTISGILKIVPGASNSHSLYKQIHGQPFLRVYAKFNKESSEIIKQYITSYTILPGPLQKIIPINVEKGIYMISYSDNKSALYLKKYLENTQPNRDVFCRLLETAIGITKNTLKITSVRSYYWPLGTHYYEPLGSEFHSREEFVYRAQHPQDGILVVGEAVSRYQGWVEGVLESVEDVLDKKWVNKEC